MAAVWPRAGTRRRALGSCAGNRSQKSSAARCRPAIAGGALCGGVLRRGGGRGELCRAKLASMTGDDGMAPARKRLSNSRNPKCLRPTCRSAIGRPVANQQARCEVAISTTIKARRKASVNVEKWQAARHHQGGDSVGARRKSRAYSNVGGDFEPAYSRAHHRVNIRGRHFYQQGEAAVKWPALALASVSNIVLAA